MADLVLQPSEFALDATIDPTRRVRRVLILIHGIRDVPKWTVYFRQVLADQGYDCDVAPVEYRRYSSVPFILGAGLTIRKADVLAQVLAICSRNKEAIFDVFCHSNGTKIFSEIVRESGVPEFETVIFAGSICQRSRTDAIASKVRPARFWNLCGKRDWWPILAEAIRPDLFQQTGAAGFLEQRVFDRYYNFGHSGALKREFIRHVVVPMLLFGENEGHEGAPRDSFLRDPANCRKVLALLLALSFFSLRWVSWWLAILACLYGAYLFYSWHDQT